MTLKADINLEFARLSAAPTGPQLVSVDTGVGQLTSELSALDQIGCAPLHLTLDTPRLAGHSVDALKKLAGDLSARLSYLLEPIGLVEVDPDHCTVQMRSTPPQQGDDGTSYYELLVQRGGRISLCRYSKTPGDVRRVVPAHFTREVFHRLSADFVAAVE